MRAVASIVLLLLAAPLVGAAGDSPAASDLMAGKKLYTGKCARCHELYSPTHYNDADWNKWMTKMRRKSRLSDEEYQRLSAYLQSLRALSQ